MRGPALPTSPRRYFALRSFLQRLRDANRYSIRPTDAVLDVGSGQEPHPRADVLLDKFIADSSERSCGAGLIVDRTFVLADATCTPFPDASFDFVFCSHLLEHVPRPQALLQELERIGQRGYIETPSKVYEKLWGWPFHEWYVSVEPDEGLRIQRKEAELFDEDLHNWFSKVIEDEHVWRTFIPHVDRLGLITQYQWDDRIQFRVEEPNVPIRTVAATLDIEKVLDDLKQLRSDKSTWGRRVKSYVSRRTRKRSKDAAERIFARLQCPLCRVQLSRNQANWRCPTCDGLFPIEGAVHVLIPELSPAWADTSHSSPAHGVGE